MNLFCQAALTSLAQREEISLPSFPAGTEWNVGWKTGYLGKTIPSRIRSGRRCPRPGWTGAPGRAGSALRSIPSQPNPSWLCSSMTLPAPGIQFCSYWGLWIHHSDSEHPISFRNPLGFFCCWIIPAPNFLPGHQMSCSRGTYSPLETSAKILLSGTDFRPQFHWNLNFHVDFLNSTLFLPQLQIWAANEELYSSFRKCSDLYVKCEWEGASIRL